MVPRGNTPDKHSIFLIYQPGFSAIREATCPDVLPKFFQRYLLRIGFDVGMWAQMRCSRSYRDSADASRTVYVVLLRYRVWDTTVFQSLHINPKICTLIDVICPLLCLLNASQRSVRSHRRARLSYLQMGAFQDLSVVSAMWV